MAQKPQKKSPAPQPAATPTPAATLTPAPITAVAPITPVIKPPLSYTQKVLIAVGISAAAILLSALIYLTSDILVLCFAGLLFAVFISAPADLLAKHTKIKRTPAIVLVLITFAAIVLGGGYFMGYTITKQAQELNRTLPGALVQFANDMEKRFAPPPPAEPAKDTATSPASQTATTSAPAAPTVIASTDTAPSATSTAPATAPGDNHWITEKLSQVRQATTDFFFSESFVSHAGSITGGVVSSTFGIIGDVVVVVGVGLFFALNPKLYTQGMAKLIPVSHRTRFSKILAEVGEQLQWWFVGQLCSMISIALLTYLGLSILRIPMAITLAMLAGLMNFIPNFGPLLAAAPAVLIAFAPQGDHTSLNPARAGWVILMYVIIQLLEGWVITPFFQQRAVELPPALIIISQVVFALLLGPLGLVLATPILAATIVIVRMIYIEDILGDKELEPALVKKK